VFDDAYLELGISPLARTVVPTEVAKEVLG
jgi:hypothetical protein